MTAQGSVAARVAEPGAALQKDIQRRCLQAALAYAKHGWHVLPIWPPRCRSCACPRGARCDSAGKHPIGALVPHGVRDATTDAAKIRSWWSRWPDANVGVATGRASGIVVVDCDPDKGGVETIDALVLEWQDAGWLHTLTAHSGRGGWHFVFRYPERGVGNKALGLGLDVRGDGGYIVAAPSLHVSGRRYRWADGVREIGALP